MAGSADMSAAGIEPVTASMPAARGFVAELEGILGAAYAPE
jgi:hypothetical protein